MSAAVTILPPQEHGYGHGGHSPFFDRHAFAGRRAKAVSAETKLSFGDFNSMHVQRREKQQIRRLETPAWAMTDSSLRRVVLISLERRFYIQDSGGYTDAERLQRINEESRQRIPRLQAILDNHLIRYHTLARNGAHSECLRRLKIEINNRDTEIVMLKKGISALVTAAMFYYFRLGWNSKQIAEELGVKAPMVRIWTYRMRHIADGQKMPHCRLKIKRSWSTFELGKLRFLLANGMTVDQCAEELGIKAVTVMAMCAGHFPKFATRRTQKTRRWTPDRIRVLQKHLCGGLSVSDCARVLHATPNVISYVRRRYLPKLELPEKRKFRRC